MCDYSLHGIPNRLAVEGEQLIVRQFPTGSKGLAAVNDLQKTAADGATSTLTRLWAQIREWFVVDVEKAVPAVCIPPGARLHVENIPARLQEALSVKSSEDVTFVQLSAEPFQYRDAVRFSNGREVLLQRLNEGLRMGVVSLGVEEEVYEADFRAAAPAVEPMRASRAPRNTLTTR
jgi:hypothetical protein